MTKRENDRKEMAMSFGHLLDLLELMLDGGLDDAGRERARGVLVRFRAALKRSNELYGGH